jgi:hypothetical protein
VGPWLRLSPAEDHARRSLKIGVAKSAGLHYDYAMKLEEIAAEASKLTEEERASLASRLLHGLQTPVYWVSDEEVVRRMQEAERSPEVLITFDELVAGLRPRGS